MLIDSVGMRSEADHWLLIVSGTVRAGYEDTWLIPIDSTVWRAATAEGHEPRARRLPLAGVAAATLTSLSSGWLWTATRRRRARSSVAESPGLVESLAS
jgi:hypothetical protein